jgi:hypothetical protein
MECSRTARLDRRGISGFPVRRLVADAVHAAIDDDQRAEADAPFDRGG